MSGKKDRRGNREGLTEDQWMNTITTMAKVRAGNLPDRRKKKVATTKGTKPQTDKVWTRAGIEAVSELLIAYNGKSKKDFTEAFLARKIKSEKGKLLTSKQLDGKYSSVRKTLVRLGFLDSNAKFVTPRSSDVISDADLIQTLKKLGYKQSK